MNQQDKDEIRQIVKEELDKRFYPQQQVQVTYPVNQQCNCYIHWNVWMYCPVHLINHN